MLVKSEAGLPELIECLLEHLLETRAEVTLQHIGDSLADGKGFDVVAISLSPDRSLLISPAKRSDTDLSDMISGSKH